MPTVIRDKEDSESSSEDEREDHPCIAWSGLSRKIPVLVFFAEAIVSKDGNIRSVGERYNLAFKIVRTESRLVRGLLTNHGFHEIHPNSNDFNLMWTGSHLKPYLLRSLQDFQKVNHFPRSYELTRKDRLYKNIQRMQQAHGFKNFHIIPQTFVLPSEYQEFCSYFVKDQGPWIIKPVASSRGRGIYLVSNPNQIPMDENILVSRYINNPLLIDDFKFDVRLYVLVTSYDPLTIYLYEEGLARFATVKYDCGTKNIKNQFMHLTNYSVNKKSSDYVSCDDPEVEDYGNKWSMSAMLRYLKQEGKDTTLLMSQVEDLVIKAVLSAELQIATACKMFVPHRNNCFELYGFDVLIDSNLKSWLLEVNLSPSLACDAPLDLKIKASMISDMFSLVGFVCQDPLLRQPRSERVALDPGLKYPAHKAQRPLSAQSASAHSRVRQRPLSANNTDTDGPKEKPGSKQRDSTLGLTAEELKVLRRITEEHERRGGFIRIFPTPETWELYSGYLEYKTSMNSMLANRLFHGRLGKAVVTSRSRKLNGNVQLQVDVFHACHVIQYERKLLSLEARRRRQRHLAEHSAMARKRAARGRKASPTGISDEEDVEEGEERVQEEEEKEKKALGSLVVQTDSVPTSLERFHNEAMSSAEPARRTTAITKPKVNLLHILQQGWDLSKVQARMAFSSYLHRVQMRLLAESRTNANSAWPEKDNEQMELVIRFLKRAASNLQQDMRMVLPSRQLPLQDRRRILSHQLGEFIHCYNKETEHMVKKLEKIKDEEHCINPSVFQEFIAEASEGDLEEVLTFYTHKNKSASVFLGTKCRSTKPDNSNSQCSGEPATTENHKTLPVAKEGSSASASESSLSEVRKSTDQASVVQPTADQPTEEQPAAALRSSKQPEVQASQHSSSFPAALDCGHIHLQHYSHPQNPPQSLPLHCPPPPPPSQPPSYAQSQSRLHCPRQPEPPPQPQASVFSSASSLVPQPPRVIWAAARPGATTVSAPPVSQVLRQVQSFTSTSSSSAAAASSSMPGAIHIHSQKLPRPSSAGQAIRRTASSRPRPDPNGVFKDLDSLPAQAQSNQQAIVSALQKLAEKQAARQYNSSSHISLLTQHLTNLNLTNRVLSRGAITLTPAVRHGHGTGAVTQRPVRAVHSDTGPIHSTTGPRALRDEEGLWDGETQSAYNLVTGVSPQQRYQPIPGSYQLQFAIQQLQQQKFQSRQLLDQSRTRHQAMLAAKAMMPPYPVTAPRPQAPTGPSSSSPAVTHPGRQNHSHACAGPGHILNPKPPSSAREGLVRKTATQRLNKQTSSEGLANGALTSNSQHVVYEAVCGKAGLSVYSKLFQGQGSKLR
ncbi:tubulin polyglutamylase TTLL5 isoform X1 [Coregonus clupeaformis]|uniref:tubulin polyglutamylase TTLL5 isoform X1 n=1 Tax=Coregonus clupeaformis TaxID=59861 RepID=UPI001E1C4928|nr:tubulin polyglutamylase TTLL5 isoform X1 [Coregonus clupeaformis]XP_045063426.1 tubulin polyglutamylase TTLL5 isoform X1 [Coregonus clupeaformis]